MTDASRSLSIIAYYLSEYNENALSSLGFETQKAAFKEISVIFNRDNNYLKLRRDEFDALPDSSSHRNGWRNRPPAKEVVNIAAYLKRFTFDELTELVKSIIDAQSGALLEVQSTGSSVSEGKTYTEAELENLINFEDPNATVKIKTSPTTVRVYNPKIIRQLKKLYKGNCQLCGCKPFADVECDLTEVHHIEYFAATHNNNASNLIVLCPNHHRLIHKLNPKFDSASQCFIYPDGEVEEILLNYHL
jgi:predicted HNH restriction endonuclease